MKRKAIIKRLISGILAVTLSVGVLSATLQQKVEASNAPEVTLTLTTSGANGAMTFSHSELTEEYAGNSATWTPVRYQFDAYKDGNATPEKIWIEFVGESAYFWGAGNYGNQTAPTTSLKIAKDTVLKECTVAGDIATEKANGKTMVLKEEVSIINDGGLWKQETTTPATSPEVTLKLTSSGANGAMTFTHSELTEEYEGNSALWVPVRYQFAAYKDGNATPEKIWIEFVGAEAYFWGAGNYGDQTAPTTSLKIAKDTVLKECTVAGDIATEKADGKTMVLKEEVSIINDGGLWKQETTTPAISPEVTLTLTSSGADGAMTFTHSELTAEYQGDGVTWPGKRYQFDAYKDGDTTPETVWIEIFGAEAYFWGGINYGNDTAPTTSLKIAAGTVLKECTVSGSTPTETPNGKTMILKEEVSIVKDGDSWKQEETTPELPPEEPPIPPTPPTPPADAPKVLLDFKLEYATGWILSFDNEDLYHGGEHTLSSVWIDGTEYYNVKIEFPTWTNELSADEAYMYQQYFPNGALPGSTFEIKKDTVLTNDTTGEMSVIAATLTVTKTSAGWESNHPVVLPEISNEIKVKYDRFEGDGFYVDVEIVAGPDKGKNVADVYGEWGTEVPTGNISYMRNGQEEKMKVLWPACNGNELYIIGDYRTFINEMSHIMLKKDTIITPQSAEHSQVPMKLVNDLTLQKYDEYDIWAEAGKYTEDTVFNDIKVTFVNFDGQGFYFNAEIVAGPDKGKKVADVYGDWAVPSPTGNMTYTLAGSDEKQVMNVLWSPCNETQLYISGNYRTYVDQLETVTVKKNTILIPSLEGKSLTPMRIVNAIDLGKESVYGLWGLKGEVKTPTEFIDVYLEVKQVRGHVLTLTVQVANDKNAKISDILGQGASVFGSIVLAESKVEEYTDNKAVYTIQDDSFKLFGITPATKESMEVKAGTVLFAHNACKNLKPVRILNSVKLTRDAEDNWKYKTGEKLDPSTITSPATGDHFGVELYVCVLVGTMAVISGFVWTRRRRERQ